MSFPMRRLTPAWIICLLPALAGMAVFAVSVWGTYIYDDVPIARDDPRLIDPKTWGTYLTKDYNFNILLGDGSIDNLYRPFTSLSFAIERFLLGGAAWHFHLLNVVLYGVCCALVALLAHLLFGRAKVALLAGVLFAVHPVHTEVAATVVGRADLLCLIALLGVLVLHLSGPPTYRRTLGITALMVLAMGSKEQGLLLAPLLLGAELVRRKRERVVHAGAVATAQANPVARQLLEYQSEPNQKPQMSPLKLLLVTTCFVTAGYIVLREQILGLKFWWDRSFLDPAVQPMIWCKGADRVLMPFVLLGRYVHQLVWPAHLSLDYSGKVIGWVVDRRDPYLFAGLLSAALVVGALVTAAVLRRWRAMLVLLGFALTYGVVSNGLSLIGVNYAERLIFVPSAFFCIGVAALFARVPGTVVLVLGSVIALAAGAWTARYAARWNDAESFYTWSLENQPKSIRLHQLVADRLTARGDLTGAARVAASGREVFPEYFAIWTQSGAIEEALGHWDEAERCFREAARISPQTSATAFGAFNGRRAATRAAASRP